MKRGESVEDPAGTKTDKNADKQRSYASSVDSHPYPVILGDTITMQIALETLAVIRIVYATHYL